jgi:hypothetical protein
MEEDTSDDCNGDGDGDEGDNGYGDGDGENNSYAFIEAVFPQSSPRQNITKGQVLQVTSNSVMLVHAFLSPIYLNDTVVPISGQG